jgi:hypothetical protein
MAISNSIPADAELVAIDIAKVRNEVLIEAPGYKRRRGCRCTTIVQSMTGG